ncbi:MAG: hypothetical protein KME32_35020 [Mojavia pulchra JT2-VF2]|jgi:hypothetical protein|uniref:Jacalin-type lectin domain-containing protein n=1 Tax=Mojavia pulchra JT2-VF2 TaxID=287848 RepID=A0A951UKC1_9NOST|nr:hypothetical protein [Mojavia pulchra JT2-VF2]
MHLFDITDIIQGEKFLVKTYDGRFLGYGTLALSEERIILGVINDVVAKDKALKFELNGEMVLVDQDDSTPPAFWLNVDNQNIIINKGYGTFDTNRLTFRFEVDLDSASRDIVYISTYLGERKYLAATSSGVILKSFDIDKPDINFVFRLELIEGILPRINRLSSLPQTSCVLEEVAFAWHFTVGMILALGIGSALSGDEELQYGLFAFIQSSPRAWSRITALVNTAKENGEVTLAMTSTAITILYEEKLLWPLIKFATSIAVNSGAIWLLTTMLQWTIIPEAGMARLAANFTSWSINAYLTASKLVQCFNNSESYEIAYGGSGGSPFRDDFADKKLAGFQIRHGDLIDSIRTLYVDANNTEFWSDWHGNSQGGTLDQIRFQEDEYVTGMKVFTDKKYVTGLVFCTNKTIYGKYGKGSEGETDISRSVKGFFGSCGDYLDKIGFLF